MKRRLKSWYGFDAAITIGKEYKISDGTFLDDEGDVRAETMGRWENIEGEAGMTPAQLLNMEEGKIYRLNHKGTFYNSPFVQVKLARDDGTRMPMFYMLEGPSVGDHLWIDLDWILKSPLTRKAAEVKNIFNEDISRTGGNNTMTTQTLAQKAGLQVGDKVRLIEEDVDAEIGEILTLKNDDGTSSPFFENSEGLIFPVLLNKVQKADDDDGPRLEKVAVGGPVKVGDTVFTKDGRRDVIDTDADGPDGDNEYSTQEGYENADEIETICRVVKPKPETVKVTIELTKKDIGALRRAEASLIYPEIDDTHSEAHRKAWVSILERLSSEV